VWELVQEVGSVFDKGICKALLDIVDIMESKGEVRS
jgi:hypothetical protein